MILTKLVLTDFQSCCYLLAKDAGGEALVVDPGGEPEHIIAALEQERLTPVFIVNTHGHADHIGANRELKRRFPKSKLCIHREAQHMLPSPEANLSALFGVRLDSPPADVLLTDGEHIDVEGLNLRVIHVPGHTPGDICLFFAQGVERLLFSGDTLFASGLGRSDFPGGNHQLLVKGIREKLFSLPGNTRVLPGHGPETTIAWEKKYNPFCKIE